MKRFGIENTKALGIPIPELRKLAKVLKKDHGLAAPLSGRFVKLVKGILFCCCMQSK
jgi:3-methyladenine DNA glycosylase AlkD